jgi:sec-independent protein translocase protein TatC
MLVQEFRKLVKGILLWIVFLIGFSFFFFLPIFAGQSLSILAFKMIKYDLLPSGVELIVTNPLSAFLAQLTISLTFAFLVTVPVLIYLIISYISPALYREERRAVMKVIFPSSILFFSGCLFAYFVLIPSTFRLLYPFALSLGASSFFLVDEFIHLIFGFTIITGVLFLLPVFMVLLSFFRLVPPNFWLQNWRYALAFFLIFSAIITPDGTGVTMLLLLIPLVILYILGSMVARRGRRRDN